MKLKSCKINIHEHGIKEIISFSIDHFQCLQGWERLPLGGSVESKFCTLGDLCSLLDVWRKALHSDTCLESLIFLQDDIHLL